MLARPDTRAVLERYDRALGRVVSSYAHTPDERADLGQDIAVALLEALPRFRGESSELGYVLRVAHNCGLRHVYRRRRRSSEPLEPHAVLSDLPSHEAIVADTQTSERLAAAVRALPVGLRQVIGMALEGLSHREIGSILGLHANAVGMRLHRARNLLRTALAPLIEEKRDGSRT